MPAGPRVAGLLPWEVDGRTWVSGLGLPSSIHPITVLTCIHDPPAAVRNSRGSYPRRLVRWTKFPGCPSRVLLVVLGWRPWGPDFGLGIVSHRLYAVSSNLGTYSL